MGLKFKVNCEPVGDVIETKNGFLRKYIVAQGTGKEIITVFSKEPKDLSKEGT